MNPVLLEVVIRGRIAKTGKKVKMIVLVCFYDMPGRVDEIMAIANKYEIPVLENAAEVLGAL